MIFTSYEYFAFFALVFALYWGLQRTLWQNILLLVASYVFYGWIHPWFCILLAASTLGDFLFGLAMTNDPTRKRRWLVFSLIVNLGMLSVFKYFNFFVDNVQAVATSLGLHMHPVTLRIFLPVGISFYTFQSLSYTIDVYRGKIVARRNLLEFATFVALFPQLVAGPIVRARDLLPQVEAPRKWDTSRAARAVPLIVIGYLKKLVIADNVAPAVDKVFMLADPSLAMLAIGALGFAVQIYTDFSAYTDIARGSAQLLGFELAENFDSPYTAISPSDFWRRWHISFSSWIRDYLYIPLGGSRVTSRGRVLFILLVSMGISGLWHGAAWNYLVWGIYHALLLFAWRQLGLGGHWQPATRLTHATAWAAMFCFTLFGWLIFRAPSMSWLTHAVVGSTSHASDHVAMLYTLATIGMYSAPLLCLWAASRPIQRSSPVRALAIGLCLVLIVLFAREGGADFIYFQF